MSISPPTQVATCFGELSLFIASPFPASGRAPRMPSNSMLDASSPSELKPNTRGVNSSSSIDPSPRTNSQLPINRWQSLALPAIPPHAPIFLNRYAIFACARLPITIPFSSSARGLEDRAPLFFRSPHVYCRPLSPSPPQPQFPSAGSERIQCDTDNASCYDRPAHVVKSSLVQMSEVSDRTRESVALRSAWTLATALFHGMLARRPSPHWH